LGLPAGILKRAQRREFGPCFTVYVIGRQDQVALKLYAALDGQKGRRHLQDLETIIPTRTEMEFAVHWLLDRKTSPEFRDAVRNISEGLGFRKLTALIRQESARRHSSIEMRRLSISRKNPGKKGRTR
jgi:hypothetical protein